MFTTADQIFSWFESFTNFEKNKIQTLRKFRPYRMELLLHHVGNPHFTHTIIHVAGSKGKGSTASFLSGGLTALGYRTGNYLSPHISDYRERITCNGRFFPDELYLEQGMIVARILEELYEDEFIGDFGPTTFELLTILAFLMFREAGCERVVLETGIGGRLDATNVVRPAASVITPIEMEHADVLGDTIEKIAFEKAGIIKPGIPVFSSRQNPAALAVLKKKAEELGSRFYYLPDEVPQIQTVQSLEGSRVKMKSRKGEEQVFNISMIGDYQAENSALAYLVLSTLYNSGDHADSATSKKILHGFSDATLPGRLEIVSKEPLILVDGAHTESSVRRVIQNIRTLFPDIVIIFGSISGKRNEAMIREIAPVYRDIIISRPGTFKESDPAALHKLFCRYSKTVQLEPDPEKALLLASRLADGKRPILVLGSFYMAGEIRALLARNGTQEAGKMVE
jgi:dihydrofolate synthase / folylpolyglutamate synthase